MARRIEVTIDEDAHVKVDVVGGAGPSCKKHLDAFRGLGKVVKEELKPEFYKAETNINRLNVRNG